MDRAVARRQARPRTAGPCTTVPWLANAELGHPVGRSGRPVAGDTAGHRVPRPAHPFRTGSYDDQSFEAILFDHRALAISSGLSPCFRSPSVQSGLSLGASGT